MIVNEGRDINESAIANLRILKILPVKGPFKIVDITFQIIQLSSADSFRIVHVQGDPFNGSGPGLATWCFIFFEDVSSLNQFWVSDVIFQVIDFYPPFGYFDFFHEHINATVITH